MAQSVADTGEWLALVSSDSAASPAAGERKVSSHRNAYNRSAWHELRDTKDAMAIARRGNSQTVELLRALRPESYAPDPIFRWRHRSLPITDSQQVTVDHVDRLRSRYAKEGVTRKDQKDQMIWLNLAGIRLGESLAGIDAATLSENSRSHRKNHRLYGMHVVQMLNRRGILASDLHRGDYQNFTSLLQRYDQLRANRDKLEAEVESIASRSPFHRTFMLGASAVRGVYRLALSPLNWAMLRTYGWFMRWDIPTALEVRGGRRFAAKAQIAALAVAITGYVYLRTNGLRLSDLFGGVPQANDADLVNLPPLDLGDKPPATPPEVLTPDPQPPTDPPSPVSVFSEDARHTHDGEGWSEQLPQMQINYSHDFMDSVGPWLEQKGYAYKYFDEELGMWLWGMNMEDIDPQTLQELYDKAVGYGAAEPPIANTPGLT